MRNTQLKLFVVAMVVLLSAGVRSVSAHCDGEKGAPCEKGAGCEKAAGGACEGAAASGSAATPQAHPGEAVYVLAIEGMTCPEACPPEVKESIEGIHGVRSVEVSFADKRAVVRTDPDLELTTAEIDKSFHNAGYFVSALEKVPAKAK